MNSNDDNGNQYYFICCPNCKNVLMQARNGTDGIIKCVRCGKLIRLLVKDNIISVEVIPDNQL